MIQCTVAQGRRPRATVYLVIRNTEGVISLYYCTESYEILVFITQLRTV